MATVINIADYQQRVFSALNEKLATRDHLECPKCGIETAPHMVEADETTHYQCSKGHRTCYWRIDPDGDALAGKSGRRALPIF